MNKRLLVKKQGRLIPDLTLIIPPTGIVSVGSDASATIELKDEAIAPEQFVIVCEGELLTLLCRVENTRINGTSLPKGSLHNLELRDQIVVGDYSLLLETGETAEKILSGEIEAAPQTEPAEIAPIELKNTSPPPPQTPQQATTPKATENVSSAAPSQTSPASPPSPPLTEKPPAPDKSLSDVLEGLKGEEKFYFLIENGTEEKRRIFVESEELWIGWAPTGECAISENPSDIAVPRAQIRKDWSGVVLYPLKNKNIWLNQHVLDEPRRLKNDDSLQLLSREKALPDQKTNIRFHEPTALLVLDSILPKELPPPVSLEKTRPTDAIHETQSAGKTAIAKRQSAAKTNVRTGRMFGYFTGLEVLIMFIGVLVAATLIFLVLEYF